MGKIIILESYLVEFFCKPTKFLFPSKKVVSTKESFDLPALHDKFGLCQCTECSLQAYSIGIDLWWQKV